MAVASRRNSSLNPNAPLFVPLAYQQVEDFSAEWWKLVQTSPWFRDYWLRERYECFENAECFADLFPDPIEDPEDADDFAELELQLEEALLLNAAGDDGELGPGFDSARQSSERKEMEKDMRLWKSLNGKAQKPFSKPEVKYCQKPPQIVSVKVGPRIIQQPSEFADQAERDIFDIRR